MDSAEHKTILGIKYVEPFGYLLAHLLGLAERQHQLSIHAAAPENYPAAIFIYQMLWFHTFG